MAQDLSQLITDGRIRGVFSTQSKARVGFGHTSKKTEQTVYMYVEETEEGAFGVQPLNSSYIPSGAMQYITREMLLKQYLPEPGVYLERVQPAMRELERTIDRAEDHYEKEELFSAEYEFKNALRIDEENIRATFGLGLTYLERNERDKGDLVFRRLARLKGAFEEKHKHLFNEFGMKLRKNRMYPQALKHYARAYKLSKDDPHLLYNMARVLYDKGRIQACRRFLNKALDLDPDFEEAKAFLKALKKPRVEEPLPLLDSL